MAVIPAAYGPNKLGDIAHSDRLVRDEGTGEKQWMISIAKRIKDARRSDHVGRSDRPCGAQVVTAVVGSLRSTRTLGRDRGVLSGVLAFSFVCIVLIASLADG